MKASTFMGAVVVFVMLLSVATSALILAGTLNLNMGETFNRLTETCYSATRQEFPNVEMVDLQFSASSASVKIQFTSDDSLLYMVAFKYRPEAEQPTLTQSLEGDVLTVSAQQFSGSATITLSPACKYRLWVSLGSGGFTAKLDSNANVETLSVEIDSGGGAVTLGTGAALGSLDMKVTSGGVVLRLDALTLKGDSIIDVEVENGGIMVPPLPGSKDVGVRFDAKTFSGGITVNREGLKVFRLTSRECLAETLNFNNASSKVHVSLQVGNGGIALNQKAPLGGLPSIPALPA